MLQPPRISGKPLHMFVRAVRNRAVRSLLVKNVRKELGIDALRALDVSQRGELRGTAEPIRARTSHERPSAGLEVREHAVRTSAGYEAAYRDGRVTPVEIAERTYARALELASQAPSLNVFLAQDEGAALRDARAAKDRIASGRALGPLDGVPMIIKEEMDVRGYSTRGGTNWMNAEVATEDSALVARLRAAGVVVLGQSMMTELGMNPIGVSGQRILPRNPHNAAHASGGSSTGSAVAAAIGLGPVAIGADGGGSIRIPASFNGVFGLKPTFGLVPRSRSIALDSTVTHFGPIGSSTLDLARVLDVISGPDPGDLMTAHAPVLPPGTFSRALGRGVKGLRIGIEEGEWAAAPEPIAKACDAALAALVLEGAELVRVRIPLAARSPAIGYCTIGIEALTSLYDARTTRLDSLGPELQVFCAVISGFEPDDYLDAQRLRTRLREQVAEALREVDVLAFPTAGCTAPRASDSDMAGFVDPPVLDAVSRFAYIGNLCGVPAATAPVAKDAQGLPIGLEIVGDAWDDACVLSVLAHLERIEAARVTPPPSYKDLIA